MGSEMCIRDRKNTKETLCARDKKELYISHIKGKEDKLRFTVRRVGRRNRPDFNITGKRECKTWSGFITLWKIVWILLYVFHEGAADMIF